MDGMAATLLSKRLAPVKRAAASWSTMWLQTKGTIRVVAGVWPVWLAGIALLAILDKSDGISHIYARPGPGNSESQPRCTNER